MTLFRRPLQPGNAAAARSNRYQNLLLVNAFFVAILKLSLYTIVKLIVV